jgi:hypothetical protein
MGFMAYGRKVAETADEVRYAFGESEGDPEAGVLVIPVADPESWYVDGREGHPRAAQRVFGKAARLRRQAGEWPEWASFYS